MSRLVSDSYRRYMPSVYTVSIWSPGLSSPVATKTGSKLAERAAQTRARLVETTLELLRTSQFRDLSLDAIAARAGVTKGAIYGHFKSKDALLMAALDSRPESRPELLDLPAGREGTTRQRLRRLGEAILAQQNNPRDSARGMTEFFAYMLTNETTRPLAADMMMKTQAAMVGRLLVLFDPEELAMPMDSFILLVTGIIPSLNFMHAMAGDAFPRETVLRMFEGLAAPER